MLSSDLCRAQSPTSVNQRGVVPPTEQIPFPFSFQKIDVMLPKVFLGHLKNEVGVRRRSGAERCALLVEIASCCTADNPPLTGKAVIK